MQELELTRDSGALTARLEVALGDVVREVGGLPHLRPEVGLAGEEVEEEARGLDAVVHHHRLHQLVVAVQQVVGLAHREAAALARHNRGLGLQVGPTKKEGSGQARAIRSIRS